MNHSFKRVGILIFFLYLSFSTTFVLNQSYYHYPFTLKEGDSVSYRIVQNNNSTLATSFISGGTYQITVKILNIDPKNVTIEINEQFSEITNNYTETATDALLLNMHGYDYVFNKNYDNYLLYNGSTGFQSLVVERNNKYFISQNDSWACHSCGWVWKEDNTTYVYDKSSGWLLNMTESYSESSSAGYFLSNKSVIYTSWNVNRQSSKSIPYSSLNTLIFSFITIIIIKKKFRQKGNNY